MKKSPKSFAKLRAAGVGWDMKKLRNGNWQVSFIRSFFLISAIITTQKLLSYLRHMFYTRMAEVGMNPNGLQYIMGYASIR